MVGSWMGFSRGEMPTLFIYQNQKLQLQLYISKVDGFFSSFTSKYYEYNHPTLKPSMFFIEKFL